MSNKMGVIKISDLESLNEFKKWVGDKLGDFYLGDMVKDNHIDKYIKYIKEEVMSRDMEYDEKKVWMEKIRRIKRTIEAKNRGEK